MGNGICKITVQGVEHTLYFSRLAQEELSRRSFLNAIPNNVKLLGDIIYSGLIGHAHRNDLQYPSYGQVQDLVEEWLDEEDFEEQNAAVDKCFRESKYGSRMLAEWGDTAKKLEGLEQKMAESKAERTTEASPAKKPRSRKTASTGKTSANTA